MFVTVEGLDGAGKSTLVAGLAAARPEFVVLREPGGVELAERLREVVKDPSLDCSPRAEALIFAAARAQLVDEKLRPLLDGGTDVLLDRYVDSSLAYQGGGRGLGVQEVAQLNLFAVAGLRPDRTLLLHVPPEIGLARVHGAVDRLEASGLEFFERVAATYDQLAAREPDRWVVLDATQPAEAVLSAALSAL